MESAMTIHKYPDVVPGDRVVDCLVFNEAKRAYTHAYWLDFDSGFVDIRDSFPLEVTHWAEIPRFPDEQE